MLLFLDCETRSELDLSLVGSYKYLSHPSTELLMIAYAWGEEEVKLWECHKECMPQDLKNGLEDELQMLVCWNGCSFERLVFRNLLDLDIPVDRIIDPMILSRYLSMPGKQEKVGKILDIDHKKLVEKARSDESVISFFCTPLSMGGTETLFGIEPTYYRNWDTHPKEWRQLCNRCIIDVKGMVEIYHRVSKFPLPDFEYELYELDQRINDYGIYTDSVLLQGATLIVEKEQESLHKEFKELTGIKNPRSTPQVLAFVRQHGYTFPSIGKSFVNRALAGECSLDDLGKKALLLRKQISKSSVAKLESCKNSVESDNRVRGLFNFMGAARTGRWTSGLFQAHNLIKATKEVEEKYDLALNLLRSGDYEGIRNNFSSPIDCACSALRPILRAPSGSRFIIADLAAIESRGAGWVAGCDTLMQIFREDKDPYCFFASLMDPSRTYEDFYHEYKVLKKKKNRNDAKPPFLGCFGKNTEVVTNHGVKRIVDITKDDLLWDGLQWVSHDGVAYQGDKQVIEFYGVDVTPEHKILCGKEWREAWEVNQNILLENRATNLALGSFLEERFEIEETARKSIRTYVDALAEQRNGIYEQILNPVRPPFVIPVLGRKPKLSRNSLVVGVPTFDIVNSGPNNRFTILTDSGPMIVHNCGYGLGPGDIEYDEDGNMVKTGLLKYGSDMGIELSKEYAEKAVLVYRNKFSEVCDFWYDLQRAFIAVATQDKVWELGPLRLDKEGRVLRVWLPSGRALHYINPEVTWSKKVSKRTGREYDAPTIWIDGIDQKTHQWTRIETRGTKVFENVVQGLCRDILGVAMLEADKIGFKIVLHCHDEIAAEVPYDSHLGLQHLIDIMRKDLPWAPGFLLDADGFEAEYYKK